MRFLCQIPSQGIGLKIFNLNDYSFNQGCNRWGTGIRGSDFLRKLPTFGEKIEQNPKILASEAPKFLKIGKF